MKINIPCPSCGCQHCEATTISGEKVKIEICSCNDGSGDYNVSISTEDGIHPTHELYRCDPLEIEDCLTSRFKIDLESMNHRCFN